MREMTRRKCMMRTSATVAVTGCSTAWLRNTSVDALNRAPGIQLYTVADALKNDVLF